MIELFCILKTNHIFQINALQIRVRIMAYAHGTNGKMIRWNVNAEKTILDLDANIQARILIL